MIRAALLTGIAMVAPAQAQDAAAPVLQDAAKLAQLGREAARYPLLDTELKRARGELDGLIRAGLNVPVPKDTGGGFTHEQHKRNYRAIYLGGLLFRITGEQRYADFARDLLLAYAKLYPTLGKHPAGSGPLAGRLFWQSLNDSVWLTTAIQGYDQIRGTLSPADRATIDTNVFRRIVQWMSVDTAASFDRIHNHATWMTAGVGMTGYVLREPEFVERALKGSDRSGRAGFLKQLDLLFSPDGYYAEGPYYQRYALQPFVVFADAVERNDPALGIFRYRDGIVPKAVRAGIEMTYRGHFFPINDALREKSLKTEELYQAVTVGYGVTHDPSLLSVAQWQGRTVLTPAGLEVARDLAAGKAVPFAYRSQLYRDGPDGKDGALAVLRSGPGDQDQVLVAKNTAMGMGHGHFDKLNWLLYDHGQTIVTDYGAARFINIEAKDGGKYLPENDSWAHQTIAHNTLVANETSHFNGREKLGETVAPKQLFFGSTGATRVSTAEVVGTYPGTTLRRSLAQVDVTGRARPLIVDLLRVTGPAPARYDLPLHYDGQLIDTDFALRSNAAERPVLGKANGYQHLWVDATGTPAAGQGRITWLLDGRFYSYRMATPGAAVILAESGAGDPKFNLRREPAIIQRLDGAKDATFVSVLESHGQYDPSAETTVGSASAVAGLKHVRLADADAVIVTMVSGDRIVVAFADDVAATAAHKGSVDGRAVSWSGHVGRFDWPAAGAAK
ncbi:MAG: heparinase II/III family protein [Pseudomonadota bacterium]